MANEQKIVAKGKALDGQDENVSIIKGLKKTIIAGFVVVILAIVGAGAAVYIFMPTGEKEVVVLKEEPVLPGDDIELGTMNVNLAGGGYLRVGITLQTVLDADEPNISHAKDIILSHFASQTASQAGDAAKRDASRDELVGKLKKELGEGVNTIFFTEYVIG